MKKKNIILGHTLDQYNKKYKHKRENLLVFTKAQVEEFDKKYGFYIFNNAKNSLEFDKFLLGSRTWWEINDKYYEIPKAPRLVWFSNLNRAAQLGICVLGVGAVGAAIGAPIAIHNMNIKFSVDAAIVENKSTDVTIIKNELNEKTGNVEIYLKVIDGKTIESIAVRNGIIDLNENDDYVFDLFENKIIFKKSANKKIVGKVIIYPNITKSEEKKVSKQQWLAKYKTYSDKFQNSNKIYDFNNIHATMKLLNSDNEPQKLDFYDKFPILNDRENGRKCQFALFINSAPKYFDAGGGELSYENIDDKKIQLFELNYDIEYSLDNNRAQFICKDKNTGSITEEYCFNCNGYLEKQIVSGYEFTFTYDCSPSEEEIQCYSAHGKTNQRTIGKGQYCAYSIFNVQNNADCILNFKAGKTYRLSSSIRKFDFTVQQTTYYFIFQIDSIVFDGVYNINELVSNFKATLNNEIIGVNFSTTDVNSLNLSKTINILNDCLTFEFTPIKDFQSFINFTGTML